MAKLGKTSRNCANSVNYSQGIGYFIPDSMPITEWRETKQKWDQLLVSSGFIDLESHSSALDGHFLPTFKQNSIEKNSKTQAGAIPAGIEGYYDYCSAFYEHADWKLLCNTKQFQRKWSLMRELFRLHKDGVSYGDMRISLTCKQSSYMKRFSIPASSDQFRQRRSKYWLFMQVSNILSIMWLWHATDARGSLTPYDLEHMECTGITADVIAKAKAIYVERSVDDSIDD